MGNGPRDCWCSLTNIDKERQISLNLRISQNNIIISNQITQNNIIIENHNEEINNSLISNNIININSLSENNSSYDMHKSNYDINSQLSSRKLLNIDKLSPEKKTCIICLENFKESDKIINLSCFHMFHNNCIRTWLNDNNNCPLCKNKIFD